MLAIASPLVTPWGWGYLLLVLPMAVWVMWEFARYERTKAQGPWFRFFLALNTSMLVFLLGPLIDRL
jgi:hypothetical protein